MEVFNLKIVHVILESYTHEPYDRLVLFFDVPAGVKTLFFQGGDDTAEILCRKGYGAEYCREAFGVEPKLAADDRNEDDEDDHNEDDAEP